MGRGPRFQQLESSYLGHFAEKDEFERNQRRQPEASLQRAAAGTFYRYLALHCFLT